MPVTSCRENVQRLQHVRIGVLRNISHGKGCAGAQHPFDQEEDASSETEIGQSSAQLGRGDDVTQIPEERPCDEEAEGDQISAEIESGLGYGGRR